jgi:hypothetical protein
MYDVRLTLSAEQLMETLMRYNMIDLQHVLIEKSHESEFSTSASESASEILAKPKRGGQRGPRGSKVQDALRAVLTSGPQTSKQLRSTLEQAGFSGGSLSTSLAQMLKTGEIEKSIDGTYKAAA